MKFIIKYAGILLVTSVLISGCSEKLGGGVAAPSAKELEKHELFTLLPPEVTAVSINKGIDDSCEGSSVPSGSIAEKQFLSTEYSDVINFWKSASEQRGWQIGNSDGITLDGFKVALYMIDFRSDIKYDLTLYQSITDQDKWILRLGASGTQIC